VTVATARIDGELRRIVVTARLSDKERLATIPGCTWHKASNTWRLPLTWAACLQLRGVFRDDLELDESLIAWAWEFRRDFLQPIETVREAMALSSTDGAVHAAVNLALNRIEAGRELTLKPFQRAGVAYLFLAQRAGLYDEMGTGKTVQLIRTLQVLKALGHEPFPALVVCPNSLKNTVWARELATWAPELAVVVVHGSMAKRREQLATPADVYVINYDLLKTHSRLAPYGPVRLTDAQKTPKELNELGHRTVIFDEAHRLCHVGGKKVRNEDGTTHVVPSSQQTLAAFAVAHQAEYRYVLTGTPVNDTVGDLWGLLHAILPDWFPSRTRYLDRYAETSYGLWGGAEVIGLNPATEPEFRSVTSPLYRRVLKAVALPQLPPKLPTVYRETPMNAKQAKAYRQMEATMLAELNEIIAAKTEIEQFTRLLQFACAAAEVDEHGNVRLTGSSSKVDDLVDLLGELNPKPLVVAAESRQLIELAAARLTKEGISHGLVTGALSPFERADNVRRFQEGRLRAILLTLGAGAEGLTLTRADTMLFMQRSFSPLRNTQGEDRIHRIGSEIHEAITIIEQITPDTVEERRRDTLEAKGARIEDVLRDRDALRRLLGGS
jgi:SNF2 family DNA or RNA helicase